MVKFFGSFDLSDRIGNHFLQNVLAFTLVTAVVCKRMQFAAIRGVNFSLLVIVLDEYMSPFLIIHNHNELWPMQRSKFLQMRHHVKARRK